MRELVNKTALVTGASRGIGRATASALAKAGAHVLVHFGRSRQEAESLVVEIRRKGGRADAVSADLGIPDGASLLAKQVRSIVGNRLDVLVLNAGISKAARIADHTVEDFNSLFATNVRGPFFLVSNCCRFLGRAQALLSSLLSEPVRWWARLVWITLQFWPTPLPKERLKLSSIIGLQFSGRAASV